MTLVAGCGTQPSPSASGNPAAATPTPSPDPRVTGWAGDLDLLLHSLQRIHPDLYHSTADGELETQFRAVKSHVADYANDDQMMVQILRLIALVSADGRDGHTGAFIWGSDSEYPVHSLPLRVWFFGDRPYIVDALPPYQNLIGNRIVSMGGRPVSTERATLARYVPHDNDQTLRLLIPRFLLIPEVLHGLSVVDEVNAVGLGMRDPDGKTVHQLVQSVPMSDYNAWAGEYGLHLPDDPTVLYLSGTDQVLWWKTLPRTRDLYVQYNRVQFLDPDMLEALRDAAANPEIDRIIVDIRQNYGGDTFGYPPVIDALTAERVRNKPLFVITGRNTFSAASLFAAELERTRKVTFVGEPMGGSPNLYGNPETVVLPYSGIAVTIASEYFVRSTDDDPRLTIRPDIRVELTPADYFGHRDPSLEVIEARR